MKSIQNIENGLSHGEIEQFLSELLENCDGKKVLVVPPDATRAHSGGGLITALIYKLLDGRAEVRILPALGTHAPMSSGELADFFGSDIPPEVFIEHDWRNGTRRVGEVPAAVVRDASSGWMDESIAVELADAVLDPSFDMILSVGQIVPHEVAGFSGYSKNILVGCGGGDIIGKTHMLGAAADIERVMGCVDTPVRRVFDYAQREFISKLPITYLLTVAAFRNGTNALVALLSGKGRDTFERAAEISAANNIFRLDTPPRKFVVYLDPHEYRSTWLGNKAIYRTRKATADGGELLVLAPGVKTFGEDTQNDRIIRKFGYVGHKKLMSMYNTDSELHSNPAAAAHLIHGSPDGRFSVTYAAGGLTRSEVEGVGYRYMPIGEAMKRYNPDTLGNGYNELPDGESVYFIRHPGMGLWTLL